VKSVSSIAHGFHHGAACRLSWYEPDASRVTPW
jgi:hypothetical protein